jgi:hypothetical protein
MNHASYWTGQQALEGFPLARAIRKFYAAYDHLTLIGIGKTPAANQSNLSLGNFYTSLVISWGCKNRRIHKQYTSCITHKEFLCIVLTK